MPRAFQVPRAPRVPRAVRFPQPVEVSQATASSLIDVARSNPPRGGEFSLRLRNELILQEVRHQRRRELLRLSQQISAAQDADIVSRFVEARMRRLALERRVGAYGAAGL